MQAPIARPRPNLRTLRPDPLRHFRTTPEPRHQQDLRWNGVRRLSGRERGPVIGADERTFDVLTVVAAGGVMRRGSTRVVRDCRVSFTSSSRPPNAIQLHGLPLGKPEDVSRSPTAARKLKAPSPKAAELVCIAIHPFRPALLSCGQPMVSEGSSYLRTPKYVLHGSTMFSLAPRSLHRPAPSRSDALSHFSLSLCGD